MKKEKDAYSKSLNARFLFCPKCACTSVRKDFGFKWTPFNLIPEDSLSFFTVRNPYDRMSSQFKEIILKDLNAAPTIDTKVYNRVIRSIRNTKDPSRQVSMFFESIDKYGLFDSHLVSQTYAMTNPEYNRDTINVDKVHLIDFDNMEEELNNIFSTDVTLTVHNKGKDFDTSLINQYREYIKNLYKEDIELYNHIKARIK